MLFSLAVCSKEQLEWKIF